MSQILALGLTIAGSSALVGLLSMWCRKVPYTQLTRFPGNDAARQSYENRLNAAGIGKVRNVREVVS